MMDFDCAQYFRPYATCQCGKPATGDVVGNRNRVMGQYCRVCGERRVRAAIREREYQAKQKMREYSR